MREYINVYPFIERIDELITEAKNKRLKRSDYQDFILKNVRKSEDEEYLKYIDKLSDDDIKELCKYRF